MTFPPIDWREQYRRRMRCEAEKHPRALWVRRIDASGTHVQFFCDECDRPVTHERYPSPDGKQRISVTAEWLRTALGIDASELPEHRRSMRYHLCHLCGATALCEFHHVAPQAIYGADADRWPIVPLCEPCHDAETRTFTDRLEAYVAKRIDRYLAKRGGTAA